MRSLIALVLVAVAAFAAVYESRKAEEQLMDALYRKDPETVWRLIRGGRDIHMRRGDESTLLMIAADIGDPEMIREALRRGARLEDRDNIGCTALHGAMRPEAIRVLVAAGAKIEAVNDHGFTPLISAAHLGELEAVRTLLELGANPRARTDGGPTVLGWAKQNEHPHVVAFLRSKGIRQ